MNVLIELYAENTKASPPSMTLFRSLSWPSIVDTPAVGDFFVVGGAEVRVTERVWYPEDAFEKGFGYFQCRIKVVGRIADPAGFQHFFDAGFVEASRED